MKVSVIYGKLRDGETGCIYITHIPTGITVSCDTERTQLQCKAKAVEELTRLLEA